MLAKLAIPVTLAMLIAMGLLRGKGEDPAIADEYHAKILDVVEQTPLDFEGWIGRDVPLPPAAIKLLGPNAILARQYYHRERDIRATLLIVQCRDIRDMAGHFPPVCYPAHGWTLSEEAPDFLTVGGNLMKPYVFTRDMGEMTDSITVYNLFALPTGETTVSMRVVRETGSDYVHRPYGAAQIQVVLGEAVSPDDYQWILDQMYILARPTVEVVLELHAQQSKGQSE